MYCSTVLFTTPEPTQRHGRESCSYYVMHAFVARRKKVKSDNALVYSARLKVSLKEKSKF